MLDKNDNLHLHVAKSNSKLLLLLIPSIAFIFTLFVYLMFFWGKDTKSELSFTKIIAPMSTPTPHVTIGEKELTVLLADTPEKGAIGLSHTKSLSDDEGMLFVFEKKDEPRVFWMKDMSISIDIIWIDDYEVVQIDKNVPPEPGVPLSKLKKYTSGQAIDYVLEVSAGFSDRFNIVPGTSLVLPKGL